MLVTDGLPITQALNLLLTGVGKSLHIPTDLRNYIVVEGDDIKLLPEGAIIGPYEKVIREYSHFGDIFYTK